MKRSKFRGECNPTCQHMFHTMYKESRKRKMLFYGRVTA